MRVTFSDPGVGFPIFRTLYLRSPKSSVISSYDLGVEGSGAGGSGGSSSLAAKEGTPSIGISGIGTSAIGISGREEFDGGELLSPFPRAMHKSCV